MKLHEYQTKQIFKNYRLNVPNSILITDAEQLGDALKAIGDKCVLKCQGHAGGRGKAGGVKLVSKSDAENEAKKMFGKKLITHQTSPEGKIVKRIWVIKKGIFLLARNLQIV